MKKTLLITALGLTLFSCEEKVYKSEITVTYINGDKETFVYTDDNTEYPTLHNSCLNREWKKSIRCGVRTFTKVPLNYKI